MTNLLEELRRRGIHLWREGDNLRFEAPPGALDAELREKLRDQKAALLGCLAPLERIGKSEASECYLLSNAQRRMWLMAQFGEASGAYHMPAVYEMEGGLDVRVFREAFLDLIRRHEVLRTRFIVKEGEPRQVVEISAGSGVAEEDWRERSEQELRQRVEELVSDRFDLELGPVWRASLLHVGEAKWMCVFVMHHIAADGWSVGVLMRDLLELYRAKNAGEEANLPILEVQYKDYAVWQNRWLAESGKAQRSREYWRVKLGGELPVLELPLDRVRPAQKGFEGSVCRFELGQVASLGLRRLAREQQTTLFATVLALVKALLHRYSGQEDIIVGAPVAGREHWQLKEQVGFYVNTLALRDEVKGGESFVALLEKVKGTVLEGYAHQDYPFDALVEALGVEGSPSRHAVFEVMVVQGEPRGEFKIGGVSAQMQYVEKRRSKFDLTLSYWERDNGELEMELEYDRALFSQGRMERMGEHLRILSQSIVSNPSEAIGRLEMMAAWEKRKVIEEFNATTAAYDLDKTVVQLFEEQVRKAPQAVALIQGGQAMSYGELNRRANQVAWILTQEHGMEAEQIVGLACERSFEMVIGILGIMKAGAAYLPLDPGYPRERLEFMMADSGVRVVIGQSPFVATVGVGRATVDLTTLSLPANDPGNLPRCAGPENVAYVIYTSGSTGRPKGVMIEHRSLVNQMLWMRDEYEVDEKEVILQKTTYTFDVSLWELILPGVTGARMVLLERGGEKDPQVIETTVREQGVTMMHFVPSMLSAFLDSRSNEIQFGALKKVVCSGEALLPAQKNEFFRKVREVELHNLYGPTEAAVHATYYPVGEEDESVPIGWPVANTGMYIVDRGDELCPIGICGELCIGGAQVGRGYVNQPELTSQKFVENRYSGTGKMYRTGDLARWREDGAVEYLGRMDGQVKVRGHRIELGEIETVLSQVDGLRSVAVILRGDDGEKELCGYYVGEVDEREVRGKLRERLPEYMVPAKLLRLDAMPQTSSGKINRGALPAPAVAEEEGDEACEAPADDLERGLAAIWAEVLKRKRVSMIGNFFEMGGHSLRAMQVSARAARELNRNVGLRDIFEEPTVRGLARRLRERAVEEVIGSIDPASAAGSYALSNSQKRLWVLGQMAVLSEAYHMPGVYELEGELRVEFLREAFVDLVRRHEVLRTRFLLEAGAPRQVVEKEAGLGEALSDEDWRGRSEGEVRQRVESLVSERFDLENGPVWRAKLLRVGEEKWLLVFVMHHIAGDGWSVGVLMRDVVELYRALKAGEAAKLPVLEVQYKDYAVWQQRWLAESEGARRSREYWHRKLRGELPVLELPLDRVRPAQKSFDGGIYRFELGREASGGLRRVAREQQTTMFTVMVALVKVLLHRYSGQEDIIVGVPVAGRDHWQLKEQVGMYTNTLALRDEVKGAESFVVLLEKVKRTVLESYEHQYYPFDRVLEELEIKREWSRHPVFEVMVVQNEQWDAVKMEGMNVTKRMVEKRRSKFDLTLGYCEREGGAIGVEWEYDTTLFGAERLKRMGEHFGNLVDEILRDPKVKVGEVEIMSAREKKKVIEEFNTTSCEYPLDKSALELFEEQAGRMSDAVALIYEGEEMSYRELNRRANRVGRELREKFGVQAEEVVGLVCERSFEMVVGILGIMKAGGAYMPIDPNYPFDRKTFMVEDSQVRVVIGQRKHFGWVNEERVTLALDEMDEEEEQEEGKLENRLPENRTQNLAYVIYTSGSTGKPKGVMIEQRGLVNVLNSVNRIAPVLPDSVYLLKTNYTFDVSVVELFCPILWGGRMVILPVDGEYQISDICALVYRERVTHLTFVPTPLGCLVEAEPDLVRLTWSTVRHLLIAGEELPVRLWRSLLPLLPTAAIWNLYGPTEATIYATGCLAALGSAGDALSIGKPLGNVKTYVLQGKSVAPIGIRGQLAIGGLQVSRGYINPTNTVSPFSDSPFDPGERIYLTGDIAAWEEDGSLSFFGRADNQVKINGYRIELGEIEATLGTHPTVFRAKCSISNEGGVARLVAHIVPKTGSDIQALPTDLRRMMRSKVPGYMVPSWIVIVSEFPLNSSGKIDVKALLQQAPHSQSERCIAPAEYQTQEEEGLIGICRKVLRRDEIRNDDTLAELAASSLQVMQIMQAWHTETGTVIRFGEMYEKTLRDLAATGKG